MTVTVRDVIIVGSGPAEWTAAIYAARAELNPLVVAGSVTAGGALINMTDVENFPGFLDGVQGPDLMATMQGQAERFGTEILFDDATDLDLTEDVKRVTHCICAGQPGFTNNPHCRGHQGSFATTHRHFLRFLKVHQWVEFFFSRQMIRNR